jgi:hypothetical protein
MAPADGPVRHRVEVTDLGTWAEGVLGVDPRGELTTLDWLAVPAQRLAEVTGGAVFTDGLGELGPARERLAWYPPDVWRFLLAGQWQRIAQEEPLPGRCAEVGDELGSRLVTARLVRELVRLALLQERTYAPYGKWLGTAFARSPAAARLGPALSAALPPGTGPNGRTRCAPRTAPSPSATASWGSPGRWTRSPGASTTAPSGCPTVAASPAPCRPRPPMRAWRPRRRWAGSTSSPTPWTCS